RGLQSIRSRKALDRSRILDPCLEVQRHALRKIGRDNEVELQRAGCIRLSLEEDLRRGNEQASLEGQVDLIEAGDKSRRRDRLSVAEPESVLGADGERARSREQRAAAGSAERGAERRPGRLSLVQQQDDCVVTLPGSGDVLPAVTIEVRDGERADGL